MGSKGIKKGYPLPQKEYSSFQNLEKQLAKGALEEALKDCRDVVYLTLKFSFYEKAHSSNEVFSERMT